MSKEPGKKCRSCRDSAAGERAAPTGPGEKAPAGGGGVSAKDTWGTVADRRVFPDRRRIRVDGKVFNSDGVEIGEESPSGLDRRRGPGRRLSDFTRSAEEGEMTQEQFLFLIAMDEFKKANQIGFPTWSDVLEVVRLLGYRKTCASEIVLRRAEDWRERGDAPSNVRPPRWAEHAPKHVA